MRGIRLRQIEVFNAVMECGTVVSAAQRLGTSQPTASRVLADLEEELGFDLFTRQNRRLLPTPEAHVLHEEVRANYTCLDRLSDIARQLARYESGTLRIAAAPSLAISILPTAIRRLLNDCPDVRLLLEVHSPEGVLDCVQNREFDIGITAVSSADPSLTITPFCQVEAVCILLADHALAKKKIVRPEDLDGQPFITLGASSESRKKIDLVLQQAEVQPATMAETQTASVACAMVNQGIGVSLLDFLTFSVISKPPLICRTFRPRVVINYVTVKPRGRPSARVTERFENVLKSTILEATAGEGDHLHWPTLNLIDPPLEPNSSGIKRTRCKVPGAEPFEKAP